MSVNEKEMLVEVEGLGKKFCRDLKRSLWYGVTDIASELCASRKSNRDLRQREFWALKDVSFGVARGECLGVIGVNGAGKSTILKLLNGLLKPDRGTIRIRGKVSALIGLGAGFNPVLSGRENIYINAAVLGIPKAEVDANLGEIIDFAEIGDAIDAPVGTYSSGMRVRLGFSVAIHCKPDILLIDEVLAVGDLSFVNKSLRRLAEYRAQANAIMYVSHNLEQVRILCDRVILLHAGSVVFDGESDEAIRRYHDLSIAHRLQREKRKDEGALTHDSGSQVGNDIVLLDYGLLTDAGELTEAIGMKDPLRLYCDFEVNAAGRSPYFIFTVQDEKGSMVLGMGTNAFERGRYRDVGPGRYRLTANVENHHLMPGVYSPAVAIRDEDSMETYSRFTKGLKFAVKTRPGQMPGGVVHVEEEWRLDRIV